jgi:hypothetical protein
MLPGVDREGLAAAAERIRTARSPRSRRRSPTAPA